MTPFIKYPKTLHLEGSGVESSTQRVPLAALRERYLVIEEKLDGSQLGFYFDERDQLTFQSRGSSLGAAPQEDHLFELRRALAPYEVELYMALGRRYICFGEWLWTKHTVFYDALPCPFLEFDLYDKHTHSFLSTDARHALLAPTPIKSVPVVWRGMGAALSEAALKALIKPSRYKSPRWRECLALEAKQRGVSEAQLWAQTDPSDLSEGLYIKEETRALTVGRYKYVRPDFIRRVVEAPEHWRAAQAIPNQWASLL